MLFSLVISSFCDKRNMDSTSTGFASSSRAPFAVPAHGNVPHTVNEEFAMPRDGS